MNRGLLAKALRESWPGTLLLGAGLAVAEAMLAYALLKFQDQLSVLLSQLTFVKGILQAFLGSEVAGHLGPEMLSPVAWVHPLVLTLVWTHAIFYCTRVPAGEVDRGTIDVLLSLPVSRWQIYCAETLVWLASGITILLMGAAGNTLGSLALADGFRIDPRRLGVIIANLFCLYLAVGGLAWTVSAMSNRRGRAGGVVFAFVLASFLLNYLAQFWPLADRFSFLSVLHYYRPLLILRDGAWPIRDMAVLLTFGAALWIAGGSIFARRDLATL